MDYRLELLDEDKFQELVNTICVDIMGTGVISFSKGKDGGRDGRFTGKAQHFISDEDKWEGDFIIQAKHTSNPEASCSDPDFKKEIDKEIIKIKTLKDKGEIDNYIIFTNRKYSGIIGSELRQKIIDKTGVKNVEIIGKETLNNNYLNANKNIVRQYRLDVLHFDFRFSENEIKEIILAFKKKLPEIKEEIKADVDKLKYDYSFIEKEEKNKKNDLSEEYFKNEILSKSLMEFKEIEKFLNDPINSNYKDYYYDTAHELNQIITIKRENFNAFEELFLHIYQLICDGDISLKGSKRHVTTFLHYMYMECLIGKK